MSFEGSTELAARLVPRDLNIPPRNWDISFPTSWSDVFQVCAGSGLSSFVAEAVLQQIVLGPDSDRILVVASSKESAGCWRDDITSRLAAASGKEFVAASAIVSSVHSLAFALLRLD